MTEATIESNPNVVPHLSPTVDGFLHHSSAEASLCDEDKTGVLNDEKEKLRRRMQGLKLFAKGEQERRLQLDRICDFYRMETVTKRKQKNPSSTPQLLSRVSHDSILRQPSMPTIDEEAEDGPSEGRPLQTAPHSSFKGSFLPGRSRAFSDPPLPLHFRQGLKTRGISKLRMNFEENSIPNGANHVHDTEASSPLEEASSGSKNTDVPRFTHALDIDITQHPLGKSVSRGHDPELPESDGLEKDIQERSTPPYDDDHQDEEEGGLTLHNNAVHYHHSDTQRSLLENLNHNDLPSNDDFLSRTRAFSDPPQPS